MLYSHASVVRTLCMSLAGCITAFSAYASTSSDASLASSSMMHRPDISSPDAKNAHDSEQADARHHNDLQHASWVRTFSRFGTPKYNLDHISSLPFRRADAPKGGNVCLGDVGTFDSLNMFIVQGVAAAGLEYTYLPLMKRTPEDPFSLYGCLAKYVRVASDNSAISFKIDERAVFHDGSPVTARDVAFTVEILIKGGWPRYRQFFKNLKDIHIHDDRTITFTFSADENGAYNKDTLIIISSIRPLSAQNLSSPSLNKTPYSKDGQSASYVPKYITQEDVKHFTKVNMTPLMGTGFYKVSEAKPGRYVVFERVKNHFLASDPFYKGSSNFDALKILYTKNATAHFQEFLAGNVDIYFEQDPNQWHTRYDVPQIKSGTIKKLEVRHHRPVTVRTIAFNMRRSIFNDLRVRQALDLAFDFDTLNRMVFHGAFERVKSLFANTPLAHSGPMTAHERALLSPLMPLVEKQIAQYKLPHDILDTPYTPPKTAQNGDQRSNLSKADALLRAAGWRTHNGKRVNVKGEVMSFEFLLKDPRLEKIALAFRQSLKQLGIDMRVRMVDTVQYEARTSNRDFDMIVHAWSNPASPGAEQAYYFSRHTADVHGSSNYIGIKDLLIEKLALALNDAQSEEDLKAYVHNLDRFVMRKNYMIPLNYSPVMYVAYNTKTIALPPIDPASGLQLIETGWSPHQDLGASPLNTTSALTDQGTTLAPQKPMTLAHKIKIFFAQFMNIFR